MKNIFRKEPKVRKWNEVGKMIKTQRLLEVIKIVDDELAWSISQCIASSDIEQGRKLILESNNEKAIEIIK